MTNIIDSYELFSARLDALIDADLATYDPDASASESNCFRLTIDLMHAAARELATPITDDPAYLYYFSDSTYDEINNPASAITDCNAAIACFYEIPDDLADAMHALTESITYMIDPDDFDLDTLTIDEIRAALRPE